MRYWGGFKSISVPREDSNDISTGCCRNPAVCQYGNFRREKAVCGLRISGGRICFVYGERLHKKLTTAAYYCIIIRR